MISEKIKRRLNNIKTSKGCEVCGYNKNPIALDFAHIDPSTKRRGGKGNSNSMWRLVVRCNIKDRTKNIKRIHELFEEIRKCKILCANCHRIETCEKKDWDEVHRKGTGRPKLEVQHPELLIIILSYKKKGSLVLKGSKDRYDKKGSYFSGRKISELLLQEHGLKVSQRAVLSIIKRNCEITYNGSKEDEIDLLKKINRKLTTLKQAKRRKFLKQKINTPGKYSENERRIIKNL